MYLRALKELELFLHLIPRRVIECKRGGPHPLLHRSGPAAAARRRAAHDGNSFGAASFLAANVARQR
jgi:hypothetical protein